jgi:hypothetical protein
VNASGPDSVGILSTKLTHKFPLGMTLSGELVGNIKKNNIIIDPVSSAPLGADANGFAAKAKFKIVPIKWIESYMEYSYTTDSWDVHTPDDSQFANDLYQELVPNIIKSLEIGIAVNLFF